MITMLMKEESEISKVKRQHYVPRCYLKNFSNKEKIYVFDKALQKNWPSPIEKIASEKYFYDFNTKEIAEKYTEYFDKEQLDYINKLDEQEIEKYFSERIEGRYSSYLRNIIATFTLSSLNNLLGKEIIQKHIKYDLAILIAFQFIRTREFRECIIQSQEILTKKIFDLWADAEGHKDYIGNVDFEFRREFEAIEHAQFILNYEIIEKFGESLFNHIWIFAYNNTNLPLFTSDNPLVKRANIEHPYMSYSGIASKGIELALPINSNIILIMYEKEYFYMLKESDRKFNGLLSEDNVIYFNSLQVNNSYRQIYSSNNDFTLVVKMCKDNPELKDIDYKRITVN